MGGQMWRLLETQAEALGETNELRRVRAMVDGLQAALGGATDQATIRTELARFLDKANSNISAPGGRDSSAPSSTGRTDAPGLPPGRPKLMTTKELAEHLNVKVDRIYELVARRQLRAKRVGRQLRFTQNAIDEFLKQAAVLD